MNFIKFLLALWTETLSTNASNRRKSKVSCQLMWQTDIFVGLSADTWLSQPPDRFQSSLGYKSQQDSLLDFIYHQPWIITGLSLSLTVITYFRCSHTLQNQICTSDDLLWSFICTGLRLPALRAFHQTQGSNHFNHGFNVAQWHLENNHLELSRRTLLPSVCAGKAAYYTVIMETLQIFRHKKMADVQFLPTFLIIYSRLLCNMKRLADTQAYWRIKSEGSACANTLK